MGRPSKKDQQDPASPTPAAEKPKRVRTDEQKAAAKADMGRNYFRTKRFPRIVRTIRQFCADPQAYDAGVVLAALTPLLLEPVRPVDPLPPRRALPTSLAEQGEALKRAYFQALPVPPETSASAPFEVDA